jgi:mono/diheme cytochrome c family protein
MNRMVLAIGILIIAGVIGTILVNSNPKTGTTAVATGQQLYVQHCASCHGANLEGQPNWQTQNPDGSWPAPPHDATGHTWHHKDDYLLGVILYGGAAVTGNPNNRMPAFGNLLSTADATAILDYIKSTWSDDIRAKQLNGH